MKINKRLKVVIKRAKTMDNQQNKIKIRKKLRTSNKKLIIKKYKIRLRNNRTLPNNRTHPNNKAHHHKPHLNKIHLRNKNKINNKNMKI